MWSFRAPIDWGNAPPVQYFGTAGPWLFSAPFDVTLRCPTPGASIVYTTDGSEPSVKAGTMVPAPTTQKGSSATLRITNTTILRVTAFQPGLASALPETHSYIFPASVAPSNDLPPLL